MIDAWDNQKAGTTFEQFLTANGGKVDGVLAANDGEAGAIITVLQKNGLNGKVPVTGQDATAAGLKPSCPATSTRRCSSRRSWRPRPRPSWRWRWPRATPRSPTRSRRQNSHDPTGNRDVKSVLLTPESITKNNVKDVVTQGYVKASDICTGAAASVCTSLGIS